MQNISDEKAHLPHLISPLAVAPMVDWTYTHFRVFMRILAPHALLYTDMQTPGAILNNPRRSVFFQPQENPLALQLGGSDPDALVLCAQLAERLGYVEINLNLGCPSDRVLAGRFGACLMAEPAHVAHCLRRLKNATSLPVTVKTRIGIDHQDSYAFFEDFITQLLDAGCDKVIVHARKAWLRGLSPKQNRTIPPLHYDYVYDLKKKFTDVPVVINGNIQTIDDVHTHLQHVDGVMLGRLACNHPYAMAGIHHALYPHSPLLSRQDYICQYVDYLESIADQNIPLSLLLKPLFNMAHQVHGARAWKEALMSIQRSGSLVSLHNLRIAPDEGIV